MSEEPQSSSDWSLDNPWHSYLYFHLYVECGWCGIDDRSIEGFPDVHDCKDDFELWAVQAAIFLENRGWRILDLDYVICPDCYCEHGLTRKPPPTKPFWKFWK